MDDGSNGLGNIRKWTDLAETMAISGAAVIDGQRVWAESGETMTKVSPVDGRSMASIARGSAPDVDRAVRASRRRFDDGAWSRREPRSRGAVLARFAGEVEAHRERLAVLDTLESGKPISESLAEVDRGILTLSYYAEAADKVSGEIAPTDDNTLALVHREPVGVVGAVTPWNYPVTMPLWKAAPALAVGNSVVLKPAEETSLTALLLAELALQAGLPDGVFNVVPGAGPDAGAALGRHMDVEVVTFTGSSAIGKQFLIYAGQSNMKRVLLECGGKSPHVVFADAPDLEAVSAAVASGAFSNAGQVCNAGSRLLVDSRVCDELMSLLGDTARDWQPRHPFDETTTMGAIIDAQAVDRLQATVNTGISDGARVAFGGRVAHPVPGGNYYEPTVLTDCEPQMAAVRDEIFGPVLTTQRFDDVESICASANDAEFGLAAAVWTSDVSRAHRVARRLQAGNVYVNCYDQANMSMPFGGFKQSGIGVDKSLHALDNYTQLKSVWVDLEAGA